MPTNIIKNLLVWHQILFLDTIIYGMNNKFNRIAFNAVPCYIFPTYYARRIRIQIWSTSPTCSPIKHSIRLATYCIKAMTCLCLIIWSS